ncbi:MAG: hypothetical protein ACKVT2_17950 [Saprospiraceae bacterium]
MKHLILTLTMLFSSLALYGQYDVIYDSTFSGDGIAAVSYRITSDQGVFLQPDGKIILLAERRITFDSAKFSVLRLTESGALDVTYNNIGINNFPTLFSDDPNPTGLLLPNNELVVGGAGEYTPWYSNSLILHKYKENGKMDLLFGNGGAVSISEDSLSLYCNDLKIYNDTSFLVLYGGSFFGSDTFIQKVFICKLNTDGRIDSSFAINGKLELPSGLFTSAKKIVLSNDGSMYILGNYNLNFEYYDLVIKLNPDFTIDPGFQFDSNGSNYTITDIEVDEDAKLIIVGYYYAYKFKLWRYMPNGSLDNSFSKDGMIEEDLNRNIGGIRHLYIQPDGKLLLSFSGGAIAMRVNPNGSMDYSFDLDGISEVRPIYDINFEYQGASGLVRQPDGKLIFMTENESDFIRVLRVKTRP